jgi:kynurenine formamidase
MERREFTAVKEFEGLDSGALRVVDLSKMIDPAKETRRCGLRRHYTVVNGVGGYHTDLDLVTHLGTHLELPYHQHDEWKDASKFPATCFAGRGVLLRLETARPKAPIRREDLDAADAGRVKPGDTVLLDSPFHSEPFVTSPDDRRPDLSAEAAQWFFEKRVRCVGWGDGIAIENEPAGCIACHELLLGHDIFFLEVVKNLDQLRRDTFYMVYEPLPIAGLDACPVRVIAIEGLQGF